MDGSFEADAVNKILEEVKIFCDKHKIFIYAILKNSFIEQEQIVGIKVLDLPKNHNNLSPKIIYNQTLLVEDPVRNGIKIEHDGDIIITNFVSDNAEIIVSGNIHVYNQVRGRLIAGDGGNKKSRIFVMKFNPTLISIAGIYRVLDSKLPDNIHNKAVQIFLDEKDRLNIVPLIL